MKKKLIIIYFVLIVIVLFGGIYYFLISLSIINRQEFDSNLWKKETDRRIYMLSDLEEKYLRKGMSKKEVILLLGSPDGLFPDGDNFTWKNKTGYDLGEVHLDKCDYVLIFNQKQEVISWRKDCN